MAATNSCISLIPRPVPMQGQGKFADSLIGFFRGAETVPGAISFLIKFYARNVFAPSLIKGHTFEACSIVFLFPTVTVILRWRGFTQVFPAVVRRVLVDMVNFFVGPLTCHPYPDNTVSKILFPANTYLDASLIVRKTGNISYVDASGWAVYPCEFSRLWRVIKIRFNKFRREIIVSFLVNHLSSLTYSAAGIKC